MSIELKNEDTKAVISKQGAELTSFQDIKSGAEYVWQADPKVWKRHAPFLFPIVGKLKDDTYYFEGEEYHLTQHGFLRDMTFEVKNPKDNYVSFVLESTEETKENYPFDFKVTITYTLEKNQLSVTFQVENTSEDTLYFAYGNHPGFKVPLEDSLDFEDYKVTVSPSTTRNRLFLNDQNQIDADNPIQTNQMTYKLDHELFSNDAIIFETEGKTEVTIQSDKDDKKVTLSYEDFPYLGIWSPYPTVGNLICIEPWYGLADQAGTNQQLQDKLAINTLDAGKQFESSFTITID